MATQASEEREGVKHKQTKRHTRWYGNIVKLVCVCAGWIKLYDVEQSMCVLECPCDDIKKFPGLK